MKLRVCTTSGFKGKGLVEVFKCAKRTFTNGRTPTNIVALLRGVLQSSVRFSHFSYFYHFSTPTSPP